MITVTDLVLQRDERILHPKTSFVLQKGQALWVKGPNGSGKSSLLKALLGWLPHQGIEVDKESRMAYLGHQTGLSPHLTVWQHCALHPAILQFDPVACEAVLVAMGLAHQKNKRIGVLSAGQKQRLALVPLFLSGANLWLLDEPFTALDVNSVASVKALLQEQLLKGVAMLIVSHDDLTDWATHTLLMEAL